MGVECGFNLHGMWNRNEHHPYAVWVCDQKWKCFFLSPSSSLYLSLLFLFSFYEMVKKYGKKRECDILRPKYHSLSEATKNYVNFLDVDNMK